MWIILISFILLTLCAGAAPVEEWNMTFSGTRADRIYSVQKTKDGVFTGGSESYGADGADAWLIKVSGEPTRTAKTAKSASGGTYSVGDLILNSSVTLTVSDYRSGWEYARNVTMLKEGYSLFLDSVSFYEKAPWIRIANFSIYKNGEVVKKLHAKDGDVFHYNKTIDGKEYKIIESKVDGIFVNSHIMVRLRPLYQYSDGEPVIEPEIKTTIVPLPADISVLEEWNRTFGRMKWTFESYTVKRTSDGGYITAGSINPFGTDLDAFLIKADSNGSELWKRTFGGKEDDEVFSIIETDDGYVLAGKTGSYGVGYFDAWLIKTDASGNEQWNRTFGGEEGNYAYADTANSVRKTRDGGYILAGKTGSYGAGFFDVWLIKTDADGIEQWNRTFGGKGDEEAYSVQLREDGGYIIAGSTDMGNGKYPWLIRTDSNGIEKWNATFVGSDYDVLPLGNMFRVVPEPDDSYILSGAPAADSIDHKVNPVEKAAGFEMVLAIIAILAAGTFKRK